MAEEGKTFEHIQFNGAGIDLAVADSQGHVRVHTLVTGLGNMPLAPSSIGHDGSGRAGLDVAVALHWLPTHSSTFKVDRVSCFQPYRTLTFT